MHSLVATYLIVLVVHLRVVATLHTGRTADLYLIVAAEVDVRIIGCRATALSVGTGHLLHNTVAAHRLMRYSPLSATILR